MGSLLSEDTIRQAVFVLVRIVESAAGLVIVSGSVAAIARFGLALGSRSTCGSRRACYG